MTEERLMQYRGLIQEIKQLEGRLTSLNRNGPQEVTDAVSSAAEFPYSKHTKVIRGIAVEDYIQSEQRILRMQAAALCKAKKELAALEEYISSVPDATIRSIMRYRYIDGWGWRRISRRVFDSLEESIPRKRIERFLSASDLSGLDDLQ